MLYELRIFFTLFSQRILATKNTHVYTHYFVMASNFLIEMMIIGQFLNPENLLEVFDDDSSGNEVDEET